MAEVVKIKFEVDKSQLDGAISSSKTLEQELKKAGVSAQNMDAAMEGVNDALQEAGVDAKTFAKALDQSATSTKSLKTQLAEAKNEAVRMSQQFGAFSKEAQTAAQKAAMIKDEINDLNDTLDALNPDAKLNAFVKLGQGIQGGFQAATGALQVFGVENERITKLAQQFQGVLNLTQGINSVLQLKDVYGQLRLVLGLTTTAQNGLNVSMAAGAAAAAPFVAAIGAALVVVYAITEGLYEEAEAMKAAREEREKLTKATIDAARSYLDFIGTNEKLFTLMKEQGKTELEILQFRLKTLDADRQLLEVARQKANEADFTTENLELQRELDEKINDSIIQRQILEQQITNEIKKQYIESLKAAQAQRDLEAAATNSLKQQFEGEFQARLTAADKQLSLNKLVNEITSKDTYDRTRKDLNAELITLNEKKQAYQQFGKDTEEIDAQIALNRKRFRDNDLAEEKELRDKKKALQKQVIGEYVSLASDFIGVMQEFNNIETQNRIATQNELLRTGKISEEKYQKEISRIKRQQAEADRDYAIYQILIKTAQSIMTTAGQVGFPAAIPLIAAISALGAAQIVAVQNAPLPKFKKGTLNLGGGNVDADGGQVIVAHRGEAIIPRERNMAYHPAIEAIYNGRISPKDINGFVEYKLSGRIPTSVNATISSRDLRSLRPNDTVNIKNSNVIAKQIAGEIGKLYDPRMR